MEWNREKVEEKVGKKSAKLIKESIQWKLGVWEDCGGRCHHTHTHTHFLFSSPLPSLAFEKTEVLDWASPAPCIITIEREKVYERARGLFGCFKRVLLCFWPCWCSLMTDCLLAAYLFCDLFLGFIQCVYRFGNICFVQCGICVRRYGFISRSSLSMCVCEKEGEILINV